MGFDIMGHDGDEGNDSLGSSFASSFSLPPVPAKETSDLQITHDTSPGGTAAKDAAAGQDPKGHASVDPATTLPSSTEEAIKVETAKADAKEEAQSSGGGDDWKDALEANLKEWRKESSVARKKAEETRAKIEEERRSASKATDNQKKEEKRKMKEAEDEKKLEKDIQAALNAKASSSSSKGKAKQAAEDDKEKRWADVRDAWEIVRDGKSLSEGAEIENGAEVEAGIKKVEEVETDGRDLVAGDEGGKQGNEGAQMLRDIHTATQAVTDHSHINPNLAPSEPPKGSGSAPPETSTTSTQKSQASASAPTEKATSSFPTDLPSTDEPFDSHRKGELVPSPHNGPPHSPPSLTLSLFTSPSRRTLLRITAVLGINLVLPFVNGVMLGFGEIFAKEAFGFGRRWWRGDVTWNNIMGGAAAAGLGLQQAALEPVL